MSPIGRIFIVLNLILSAAFLGFASTALSSSENYKQQLADANTAHASEIEAKDEEISSLNTDLRAAQDSSGGFRSDRDQAVAQVESLTTQLQEEKRRNNQLSEQVTAIQATLNDYNSTISRLSSEKDTAVQRAHEAETAQKEASDSAQAAEMARRDAEEASAGAQTRIGDLEARIESLQQELEQKNTTLAQITEIYGVDPGEIDVLPQIDGSVLNVRLEPAPGLVMLNVGSSQDVRRGYTFEIYRGGQYKGTVRIEDVQENFSSGIITRSVAGTTMSQGDRASTHL